MMLEQSLHDPASAQFGRSSEWPVQIDQAGRAVVLPRVRAKNGFGAYRLVDYRCIVERMGEDRVRVVSLDQSS